MEVIRQGNMFFCSNEIFQAHVIKNNSVCQSGVLKMCSIDIKYGHENMRKKLNNQVAHNWNFEKEKRTYHNWSDACNTLTLVKNCLGGVLFPLRTVIDTVVGKYHCCNSMIWFGTFWRVACYWIVGIGSGSEETHFIESLLFFVNPSVLTSYK